MYLKIYFSFLIILIISIGIFVFCGRNNLSNVKDDNNHSKIAVRFLLTDLCLSTESRHTRHLSQPELIAPFQDAPGYLDHFPSSTFIRVSNLQSHFANRDSIIVLMGDDQ